MPLRAPEHTISAQPLARSKAPASPKPIILTKPISPTKSISPTKLINPTKSINPITAFPKPPLSPRPIIKKSQTSEASPRSDLAQKIASQHAKELKRKLESSLRIAAGGISTLTSSIVAKQMIAKDEEVSKYIARIGVISGELKQHLNTLGRSSKLSSPNDRKVFDSSYRKVPALWKEYQHLSTCVVHRAAMRKSHKSINTEPESSNSISKSISSLNSGAKKAKESGERAR